MPASKSPAGYVFLLIASLGWGFNWPVTKQLLSAMPPLTMRGSTGVVGALLLAGIAFARGQSLQVPSSEWPRVIIAGLLNVTCWMTCMAFGLLWLSATEAVLVAYTMPVWAALLAWPVLGERPTVLRFVAIAAAFASLAIVMGGGGVAASMEKLPGFLLVLCGAFGFALGTVFTKGWPPRLPPVSSAAWQIFVGALPMFVVGIAIEHTDWLNFSGQTWLLLSYGTLVQFCVAYVAWFAALALLPASIAAIGTMIAPVVGVLSSSVVLGDPLGPLQITALILTLASVVLATRS